jgi:hypothetical protein
MSAPEKSAAQPGEHRLAIIHLLGWMAGVAVVLSLYRTALETGWLDVPTAGREELRWWQTAYGLVYGTAISGMGLLIYRRLRGNRSFPAHPGHWLLMLGGLAFATDAIAFVLAKGLDAAWTARIGWSPGLYYVQQWLAWGTALAVAIVVLARLRTDWNWWLLAGLIAALIAVNFLTHTLVMGQALAQAVGSSVISGAWPHYLIHWARIVGTAICLAVLPVVLAGDRRPRDWLHWVGVVALVALAVVEEADQIQVIARTR